MLRFLCYSLLLPLLSSVCSKALQPVYQVTFTVTSDAIPVGMTPHITGNHEALGSWDPGAIALEQTSDGRWSRAFRFRQGTSLSYKVTLGSWENEALLSDGTIPLNGVLEVNGRGEVVTQVPQWKRLPQLPEQQKGTCTVTFRVVPSTMLPDGVVFITGNQDTLGQWNPGAVPLEPQADGGWVRTFTFPGGTYLEYKFTLGSWAQEALRPDGTRPGNSWFVIAQDTVVTVPVPAWGARQ